MPNLGRALSKMSVVLIESNTWVEPKQIHLSPKGAHFLFSSLPPPWLLNLTAPVVLEKEKKRNMESEVFTPLLEQFMLTPLVCWVSSPPSLINSSNVSLRSLIKHSPPLPLHCESFQVFIDYLNTYLALSHLFSGEDSRAADSDRWHHIIGIYWISGWDLPEWDHAWDVSNLTWIHKCLLHHIIVRNADICLGPQTHHRCRYKPI